MEQEPSKEEIWAAKQVVIREYLNDPRYTGGRTRLWNHIRKDFPAISRRDVAKVLAEDPVAQIHQPLKRRVTTRPVVVSDRAKLMGVDLIDFQKLAGKNNGYRYVLTTVDLLTKYCAVRPIKNKTQANVIAALADILDSVPEKWRPKTVICDRGAEFQAGMEKALLARGIKLIHSQAYNPRGNAVIERFNKTLKTAIFALMARHGTERWVDYLEPLCENINNSKHESTGYTPLDLMQRPQLQKDVIDEIHTKMEKKRPKHTTIHQAFSVGDYVRVALTTESAIRKNKFRKGISNNWSPGLFQISHVNNAEEAGAQPRYLLYNMTTKRKSRKPYWSYQLLPVSKPDEATPDVAEETDEEVAPEQKDEEEEELVPAAPRRTGRAREMSAAALRRFEA